MQRLCRALAHEGRWPPVSTQRLSPAGIQGEERTVDRGPTSFEKTARHRRAGLPRRFKDNEAWVALPHSASPRVGPSGMRPTLK